MVGRAVAPGSDGKGELTVNAVGVGVSNAIDVAAIGRNGDVARRLAGVPLPLPRVLLAIGKLRHECHAMSLGRAGVDVRGIGVDESSELVV